MKYLKLLCLLLILALAGCGNDNYQSSLNSVNQPQSALLQELSTATKTAINSTAVSPSDTQKNSVIKLFQSMFNASPGADLLNLCSQWLADGMTEAELANLIASTDLFKIDSLYPTYLSNYDFSRRHLNLLMGTTASDSNKHALALVMQSLLDGGWTRGEVMLTLANLLLDIPASEPSWGLAAEQLRNKLEVSYYYSVTKGDSSTDIATLQGVTASVTHDYATVTTAKLLIDPSLAKSGWLKLTAYPSNTAEAIAISKTNSQTLYAGCRGCGVNKSTDGGMNWKAVNNGLASKYVTSIAVDPNDSQVVYAGTWGGDDGVYKTVNGGESWIKIGVTSYVYCISIDPSNSSNIYVGSSFSFHKTTDSGNTWNSIKYGAAYQNGLQAFAIAPSDSQVIYVGPVNGDSLFSSLDGGVNWSHTLSLQSFYDRPIRPVFFINSIAVSNKDSKIIYAGSDGLGIVKSTDSAGTWFQVNSGLPTWYSDMFAYNFNTSITSLAIDPNNSNIVYAGTDGAGVYKSTNGGSSWHAINSGLAILRVKSITIDPKDSRLIYVGTIGGGIYKTFTSGE